MMLEALGTKEGPGWPDQFGRALNLWARGNVRGRVRTLSLFAGCGGLDIAFHDAGFDVIEMVEIDSRFVKTLKANTGPEGRLGNARPLCIDIREYEPKVEGPIDFIIGGPPCQTFSAAGRRAAGVDGTTEARGMLFWEYVRLLKALSPKGFLFENVYGITGSRGGKDWSIIVNAFEEAGYTVHHRILDAADYGVPQHRERLFIVGLRSGEFLFPRPTHGPDSPGSHPHFCAMEALGGLVPHEDLEELRIGGRYGHLLDDIPPGLNYSFYTEHLGHPRPLFAWRSKFSDFLYKADPERPVRTIKAQGGQYTGPFHWDSRRFTVDETKRLQTIPDDYQITGGRQSKIHQIGNSVPPQIGRMLAIAVLGQVFGVSFPFDLHTLNPGERLGFRSRKRKLNALYRKKAREALSSTERESLQPKPVSKREYFAELSEEFGFKQESESHPDGDIRISFEPNESEWAISVQAADAETHNNGHISITIEPNAETGWVLDVEKVSLFSDSVSLTAFTALWKAFEAELVRGDIKADLVQLNSYYQYPPRLVLSMDFQHPAGNSPSDEWRVVGAVITGRGVRSILSVDELANEWGIAADQVLNSATFLKNLGYEVRNSNTNKQIPKDHFLIPYAFPTLNPQSVQLRKRLKKETDD